MISFLSFNVSPENESLVETNDEQKIIETLEKPNDRNKLLDIFLAFDKNPNVILSNRNFAAKIFRLLDTDDFCGPFAARINEIAQMMRNFGIFDLVEEQNKNAGKNSNTITIKSPIPIEIDRNILASSSPYFIHLLKGKWHTRGDKGIAISKNFSQDSINFVVDFMHKGINDSMLKRAQKSGSAKIFLSDGRGH